MLDNLIETCVAAREDELRLTDDGSTVGFRTTIGDGLYPVLLSRQRVTNVRNWLNEWLDKDGGEGPVPGDGDDADSVDAEPDSDEISATDVLDRKALARASAATIARSILGATNMLGTSAVSARDVIALALFIVGDDK